MPGVWVVTGVIRCGVSPAPVLVVGVEEPCPRLLWVAVIERREEKGTCKE